MIRRFLLITFLILFALPAFGEETGLLNRLGRMLSPGALTKGHSYLDNTESCSSCHSNQGVETSRCLTCHQEIRTSQVEKRGLHGKFKEAKECIACHKDHKGKSSQIYDVTKLDHDQVGFHLDGKHRATKCEDCHKAEFQKPSFALLRIDKRKKELKSYMGMDTSCGTCHTKNHGKQFLGQSCTDCHNDLNWKIIKFNHQKDSDFALEGKHLNLNCKACHKDRTDGPIKFVGLAHNCVACHKDPHQKKKGANCMQCHQETGWGTIKPQRLDHKNFDHDTTQFKLEGLHANISCAKCHPQDQWKLPGKTKCDTCHSEIKKIMMGEFINQNGDQPDIDPMYRTVKCSGCHDPKEEKFIHDKVRQTCIDCHNEAFGDLWDYRQIKLGRRNVKTKELPAKERIERLQRTHRFSDLIN